LNRKEFIKRIWGVVLLPYLLLAVLMHRKYRSVTGSTEVRIPLESLRRINFLGEFICIKNESQVKIFSSRCPHLGCRIKAIKNDVFVCPCHGSSFTLDGKVIKGPSPENLASIPFNIDENTNELIIKTRL
jgi:Rieske Fe-S protein